MSSSSVIQQRALKVTERNFVMGAEMAKAGVFQTVSSLLKVCFWSCQGEKSSYIQGYC